MLPEQTTPNPSHMFSSASLRGVGGIVTIGPFLRIHTLCNRIFGYNAAKGIHDSQRWLEEIPVYYWLDTWV